MTPVVYSEATTTAVVNTANFLIGTLTNYAPMLLFISAVILIFGFLSRRFRLR